MTLSVKSTDNDWCPVCFLLLGRSSDYLGHNPPRAFHTCNNNGQWGTLNTAQCQYQSEKTKVLEQFAKVRIMYILPVWAVCIVKKGRRIETEPSICGIFNSVTNGSQCGSVLDYTLTHLYTKQSYWKIKIPFLGTLSSLQMQSKKFLKEENILNRS